MKNLECSTAGDKRFSAFHAKVNVFGKVDSIENHYQLSKRFGNEIPRHWKEAKGKKPTHFVIGDKEYDLNHLSSFYRLLWVKYLDANPDLVEYAKGFDTFSDMFKGKSINCQADVIRDYVKRGRKYVLDKCIDLIEEMNRK